MLHLLYIERSEQSQWTALSLQRAEDFYRTLAAPSMVIPIPRRPWNAQRGRDAAVAAGHEQSGAGRRHDHAQIAVAREGHLIVGYLDFVSATAHETAVIDFKTDVAPSGDIAERYPEYISQLEMYAEIIGAGRSGLLFTATGQIAWLR